MTKSIAQAPNTTSCLRDSSETEEAMFFIKSIKVQGNNVLHTEIQQIIQPFENQQVSLENLLCLRSEITNLYLKNGYTNS